MCRFGFGAAPRAIMVMRMAEVMDMNATSSALVAVENLTCRLLERTD
jgi:hypothetical protein